MVIKDAVKKQIYQHAESEYPKECCGVLMGYRNTLSICEAVPVINMDEGNRMNDHFAMNSLEIYKIERDAEKRGLDVMGFYHSHGDHPAIPSKEDRRYMIPGCLYVIVSVIQGQCVDLQTYKG